MRVTLSRGAISTVASQVFKSQETKIYSERSRQTMIRRQVRLFWTAIMVDEHERNPHFPRRD